MSEPETLGNDSNAIFVRTLWWTSFKWDSCPPTTNMCVKCLFFPRTAASFGGRLGKDRLVRGGLGKLSEGSSGSGALGDPKACTPGMSRSSSMKPPSKPPNTEHPTMALTHIYTCIYYIYIYTGDRQCVGGEPSAGTKCLETPGRNRAKHGPAGSLWFKTATS